MRRIVDTDRQEACTTPASLLAHRPRHAEAERGVPGVEQEAIALRERRRGLARPAPTRHVVAAIAVGVPRGAVRGRAGVGAVPAIARPLEPGAAHAGGRTPGEIFPFRLAEQPVLSAGFQGEPGDVLLYVDPRHLDDGLESGGAGGAQARALAGQDAMLP